MLTELVHPALLPWSRALEALSTAPARILGASDPGGPVEPGRPANLVVFDPDAGWVVEAPFASKGRNSAFLGRRLRGRVTHTVFRGALVVAEGKPTRGRSVARRRSRSGPVPSSRDPASEHP